MGSVGEERYIQRRSKLHVKLYLHLPTPWSWRSRGRISFLPLCLCLPPEFLSLSGLPLPCLRNYLCRREIHGKTMVEMLCFPILFWSGNVGRHRMSSSRFRRGYRIGSLGVTFIQGCTSTYCLVPTPVRKGAP